MWLLLLGLLGLDLMETIAGGKGGVSLRRVTMLQDSGTGLGFGRAIGSKGLILYATIPSCRVSRLRKDLALEDLPATLFGVGA